MKKKTKAHQWTSDPPYSVGEYEMRCLENSLSPEKISVESRNGELWANCPDLGWNPLDHYHDNLTNIEWKKIS